MLLIDVHHSSMSNPSSNDSPIVNRVASSALVTFNLEDYYTPGERALLDIKPWLFQELVLKEKDFREFVKQHNWQQYDGKFLAIYCSADAIIPTWAFMLACLHAQPFTRQVVVGNAEDLETQLFRQALQQVDWQQFKDAKVVIKGCSNVTVPTSIYADATARLRPVAASIMFGEPCSTVPLFKRK